MGIPITYIFEFEKVEQDLWPFFMREFAAAGAGHLVLTQGLMMELLKDYRTIPSLKQEMANAGLSFVDSHAVFGGAYDLQNYNDEMQELRSLAYRAQLRIAAEMGVDTITFHPGNDIADLDKPIEKLLDNVRANLEQLLPEAEKCGVTICLENSWNIMSTPEYLLRIMNEFPTGRLGLCYDSGHANIMSGAGAGNQENGAIRRWAARGLEVKWNDHILEDMLPHVVNCHIHDNDGVKDLHLPPGQGCIDWKHIAQLLKKAPRLKCIQSEVKVLKNNVSIPSLCNTFNSMFA